MAKLSAPDFESLDVGTLLGMVELLSEQKADGHVSLLRFTTSWKVALGTPNLDTGQGREEVQNLKAYPSLREALVALLIEQQCI